MRVGYKQRMIAGSSLLLVMLALLTWRLNQVVEESREATQWLLHTYEVLTALEDVHTALLDIETHRQGFVITSDSNFLRLFEYGTHHIDSLVERLRSLTADNPAHQRHLDSIASIVQGRVAFSHDVVRTIQSEGKDSAVTRVRAGSGVHSVEMLRQLIDLTKSEEERLLAQRRETAAESSRSTATILYASLAMLAILSLLLLLSVQKYPIMLERSTRELEQKVHERTASLTALTRMYATLSQVNQVIVRATSRDQLFSSISNVAVEFGEFQLAWIGLLDRASGRITPVSIASKGNIQLPSLTINAYEPPFDDGIIGRSIRTNAVTSTDDILADPRMHQWHEQARRGRFRSAAAVPFRQNNQVVGVLSLYAQEIGFFSLERERRLLDEIGTDISYALDRLHNEEERARAEQQIREGEARFRATLDTMLEGCQIIGFDWRYQYLNDVAAKHGRRNKEELIGRTMMEAYPGIEHTKVFEVLACCMNQRVPQSLDNEFIYPDGSQGWFHLHVEPVPEGIFVLTTDITQRRYAEEALKKSEEQFRLISENVADMIAVLDLKGRRIYNSPSYEPILGDPAGLRGTDSFQEIHPDDRDRVRTIFEETVRTGVGQRAAYRFLSKTGMIHDIESQGSVIRDERGNVSQVVVVSRDVTEQKKLEQQFLRAQRMESIGTLAGGIAHDLNNVLAPIMLSLELLGKKLPDESSQNMIRMLQATTKRGSDLIRQVLSFARGFEGERTVVQIRHLIDEVGRIVNETFPKSIVFRTSIARDLPTVSADATQLHQVLMNLCINARDAMPNGGAIEVKVDRILLDDQYVRMHVEAKTGLHVVISVTDQGMGIAPANLDRIFEPFFTTKEFGKGTGLGLSTVLSIVKAHGGFVNVYSEVGRGSTFKLYLPAHEAALVHEKETEIPPPAGDSSLILVVDDEASIREITRATLEAFGYSVITASDGTEAVAMYAANGSQIKLVLTDMMMPYLDGAGTIRAIRRINPTAKFLAVSGLKQNEEAFDQVGVTFLNKPYTSDQLLRAIHEIMHS